MGLSLAFHLLTATMPGSWQETHIIIAHLSLPALLMPPHMKELERQAEALSQEGPEVAKAALYFSSGSPWGEINTGGSWLL